jgi:hypothetical protein
MKLKPEFLMNKEGEGQGGGGGNAPDPAKELSDLKASNAALMARLEAIEKGKPAGGGEDKDLETKAREMRERETKSSSDSKALEAALRFSLNSAEFLKTNQSILPKEVSDIFKAAESEKFESAIEKDAAIKAGMIQSFFKVQSNLDLLTPGLKSTLDEYLKLTKNGKQEKAQQVFDSVFEPAFEMLKRIKKAEALGKGFGAPTNSDDAYKAKMMNLSKRQYLGEKQNGT